MKTTIIGIAGGTGSGKSTFTNRLKQAFGDRITVMYHDNYYKPHDDLTQMELLEIVMAHALLNFRDRLGLAPGQGVGDAKRRGEAAAEVRDKAAGVGRGGVEMAGDLDQVAVVTGGEKGQG